MKTKNSGFILITVIVMVLVMTILAIGIINANANQSRSNQHQVDRIKAEMLAQGAFWRAYIQTFNGIPITQAPAENYPGEKPYTPALIVPIPGAGPGGTAQYDSRIDY